MRVYVWCLRELKGVVRISAVSKGCLCVLVSVLCGCDVFEVSNEWIDGNGTSSFLYNSMDVCWLARKAHNKEVSRSLSRSCEAKGRASQPFQYHDTFPYLFCLLFDSIQIRKKYVVIIIVKTPVTNL